MYAFYTLAAIIWPYHNVSYFLIILQTSNY